MCCHCKQRWSATLPALWRGYLSRIGCHFHPCFTYKRKVELCSNCVSPYRKYQTLILYAVYRGVLRQTGVEVERRRTHHVRRSGHFGDDGPPLRPIFGSHAVSPTGRARKSPPPQQKRGSSFEYTDHHRECLGVPILAYRWCCQHNVYQYNNACFVPWRRCWILWNLVGVLLGDTLTPYLFIIALDYAVRQAFGNESNLGFTLSWLRGRWHLDKVSCVLHSRYVSGCNFCFQTPDDFLSKESFDAIQNFIITKRELESRLITV